MNKVEKVLGAVLGGLLIVVVLGAIGGYIFMFIWGLALVPLGIPALGFWQAWGILFLVGMVGRAVRGC
jgi:hypothetical protein